MSSQVPDLIAKLQLEKHPEGGYYARSYQSSVTLEQPQGIRVAGTAIYYLLEGKDFSAWHRLKSDEIWHFYAGTAVTLYIIDHANQMTSSQLTSKKLGNPLIETAANFQIIIPANHWFAAEVNDKNSFALMGCTVIPGFDFKDWELGERAQLLKLYPQQAELINRLCR